MRQGFKMLLSGQYRECLVYKSTGRLCPLPASFQPQNDKASKILTQVINKSQQSCLVHNVIVRRHGENQGVNVSDREYGDKLTGSQST